MAVDFSRAIRIRRNNTTVTHYGLTTAPSGHYIGFRSQGATRYIPLVSSSGYLMVRVANGNYTPYGYFNTNVKLQLREEGSGWFGGTVYYRLVSVSNNVGGTSVATTIKVEFIQSDGSTVWNTITATLPANTSSKTFNTDVKGYAIAFFSAYNKCRVTVTCNGKTTTSSIVTFSSYNVPATVTLGIVYAPW